VTKNLMNIQSWLPEIGKDSQDLQYALGEDQRTQALQAVSQGSFPTRRDEEWRYTPLKAVLTRDLGLESTADVKVSAIDSLKQVIPDALHLVFINGEFSSEHSIDLEGELPAGLQLTRTGKCSTAQQELIEKMIAEANYSDENVFQQLALSMSRSGILIEVDKNSEISTPVHVINYTGNNSPAFLEPALQFVHLKANSRLTLIQHTASDETAASVNLPVEYLKLDAGAGLEQYRISIGSEGMDLISNAQVRVAESAQFTSHQYLFGSRLTRSNTEVTFEARGGDAALSGLYLGAGTQHLDIRTYVDHVHANCVSNQHFRGILGDAARGVFNGLVMVQKDAQQTNAEQSNKNLLLSRDARVDTKPQLEIYADDVRCGHGATVGELDSDARFYLQSRGIDREEAAQMLIHAFAAEVTQDIKMTAIRDYVQELVHQKLMQY